MSIRHIISLVTVVLIAVLLYVSWDELVNAWNLLWQVDLRILALIIPLQVLSYYAVGAMIFSYLKQKGTLNASPVETAKMALELNFVNHILPSGGVSGASYMTWRLKHLGVGAGRATLAQVVRFVATFGAFLLLLFVALIMITIDGNITRSTILITSGLTFTIVAGVLVLVYVIDSDTRLHTFSRKLTRIINKAAKKLLRRDEPILKQAVVTNFFEELHDDYKTLRREPRLLLKPLLWGLVFTLAEVGMFMVAFWALGTPINPAPLLIGYGLATLVGIFFVTPGGAGGYELIMIAFLTSAGIPQGASVAAVLLTRTLLIVSTILSGYIFYQLALNKYGKRTLSR